MLTRLMDMFVTVWMNTQELTVRLVGTSFYIGSLWIVQSVKSIAGIIIYKEC